MAAHKRNDFKLQGPAISRSGVYDRGRDPESSWLALDQSLFVGQFYGFLIFAGKELHLPYASIDDLPSSVQTHLPPHAQEIYLAAFNNAWTEYQARDVEQRERTAHRVAWAAVKQKYHKSGTSWIPRQSG